MLNVLLQAAATDAPETKSSPILTVLLVVGFLLALLGGYVWHLNKNTPTDKKKPNWGVKRTKKELLKEARKQPRNVE